MLREQGEEAEAENLEKRQLADSIRDFRLASGVDALPDVELRQWYELETKRAQDAVILAEMLIPQLANCWPPAAVAQAHAPPSRERQPDLRPVANGAPAGIADMLDTMLAQERRAPAK